MTPPFDEARYQRTLERWQALAEHRLAHMTQLYDSGRWRRYFSEAQFVDVLREARAGVEKWRKIAGRQSPTELPVAELPVTEAPVLQPPPPDRAGVRTEPPPSPFATEALPPHRSVA